MTKKPDLSIIILNYNTKDFLVDCIKSIGKSETDGFDYEIIVVDNASIDDSVMAVRRLRVNGLRVIGNKKNLGFAAGNNVGVKQASGRYVLFLNPDTLLDTNTLQVMVEFMKNKPQAGAATCKLVLSSGRIDEACHRGFPTPWNAFCHFSGLEKLFPKSRLFSGYTLGRYDKNTAHQIDSGSGAFMMVRQEAGERIGWWDEDYFMYGEDLDLSYRLKKRGWQIWYIPTVKILHYQGVSSGIKKNTRFVSTADKQTKTRSAKASVAAMKIFYQKHYLNRYPRLVSWLVLRGMNLLEKIRLKGI